jgi:hypothetical protein
LRVRSFRTAEELRLTLAALKDADKGKWWMGRQGGSSFVQAREKRKIAVNRVA